MMLTLAKAINSGLHRALLEDPKVLLMGEDIGALGGVFRVTENLHQEFGDDRVIDTPLAESGIIGTAIGLALRGYRPVCEIQFDGFVYPAFDQITTQLAKMRARALGKLKLPIVIRIPYGGGIGAVEHHSESVETYFTHTAGLRVVTCSNPEDGYWMIQQAIASDDPIIFLEPKRRYWEKAEVNEDRASLGLHESRLITEGSDLTLVTYGPMVKVGLDVAALCAAEGRSVDLFDLRSLSPLDMAPIFESIQKTGKAVIVHEAPTNMGLGAELVAQITQECFYSLDAPVLRVGGFNTPYPPSRLEEHYLPDVDRTLDAIDRAFSF